MKYLTLFALTCLLSCQKSKHVPNQTTMKNKMTYLALGDSYTIGESVAENQRFPVQLASTMTKMGFLIETPQIVAKTGWTTDELKANILAQNMTSTYNLVSLLIGVNNQYRGRSATDFRLEFVQLLEMAIGFADNNKTHVVVLSIPDWGVTPFASNRDRAKIAAEIDAFNAVIKEETAKKGILFVDITPISRKAVQDTSLIADDGLHPSGKMYQLWVEKIAPLLPKTF